VLTIEQVVLWLDYDGLLMVAVVVLVLARRPRRNQRLNLIQMTIVLANVAL
jgi:hypothetical protein